MISTAPIIEPVGVPDIFVSGIARIENLGNGNLRFTFYVAHTAEEHPERLVVAKMVMATADVRRALLATEIALESIEGAVGDIVIERSRGKH